MRSIEWAAGLFEGEGCSNVYYGFTETGRTKAPRAQVRIGMTDQDVILDFAEVMGCGTVRGPIAPADPSWKPTFEWYVSRASDVVKVLERLLPHMGARRTSQMERALSIARLICPKGERTHCPKGHPLSGLNLIIEESKRLKADGTPVVGRRCKICRQSQTRDRARRVKGTKPENFRVVEA